MLLLCSLQKCQSELQMQRSLASYLTVPVARLVQYEDYLKASHALTKLPECASCLLVCKLHRFS